VCVDKAGKRSRKLATACCTRVCRQCACRLSAVSTGQHTVPASSRSPLQAHRDSPRIRIKTTDNDPDDAMIWAAAHLGWCTYSPRKERAGHLRPWAYIRPGAYLDGSAKGVAYHHR